MPIFNKLSHGTQAILLLFDRLFVFVLFTAAKQSPVVSSLKYARLSFIEPVSGLSLYWQLDIVIAKIKIILFMCILFTG